MKTNGNAETAGIEKPRQHNFLRLWGGLVQRTFPFMEEEVGELGPKARLFVTVCETVVKPETFKYAKWKGVGRPPAKRMPVFKAFLFKAVHDIPTTKELVERILLVIVFVYEDGNLDGIGEEIVGLTVLFAHLLVEEILYELVYIHQFRSRISG